ncbi:dipeptide/oligopeptide/nickel ABC transporter, periplasmic substrate-binding protein [Campylobacter ureolyticus RIGS 9880]|uniref:Dipeptide/oligopeptide/nickel ABC transporter, periplasmic substrate-binding protein n=1 Tax=Campylobacter ureolyticus RIGS 9880 TaxID=1032069 RepID=A0AAU8TYU4_9BACT|nr:ABC transporter substrate-binding protein [Campylobacter ureolyticus]AKT90321.1 dipeptide/oligopeptide/nickel ABC transporter, periplasmic substrate-binding protein [Campylobacter ureolyticus RIGS 9880]
MKHIFKLFLLISFVLNFALAKDVLVVGIENESSRLNPLYDEDHDPALSLLFSGLTRHDENTKVTPDLAKSWEVSKDGLTYIFDLRDDAYWHDGVKFTAQDVKFTIESAKDKKLNAPAISNYEMVKDVEILGDYKIKVTLDTPFPPFLDALSFGILPKHLLEGKDIATYQFNDNPIGTGPYKFVNWKKGESIEFVANDKFYKGTPKIKKVFLKVVPDANVRLMQLKSGELDAGLIDFSGVEMAKNSKNLNILKFKSADYRALMFNYNNEVLKDRDVRVALNYFIDKNDMVKTLLHTHGSVANNPIQNYIQSDKVYEFNPKKGDEILTKAGWKKNKKGIYEKDGKTLSFEIYSFNSDPLRVAMSKVISSELNKYGVDAKAFAKPKTAFKISKVDSFLIGWGSPFDPDFHTYRIFGGFADSDINENGWNYSHYKDAKVDEALKKARSTGDLEERKTYYKEFLDALYENPPYIFIAYLDYNLAYNKNLTGIKTQILGHHGAGFLWNLEEWNFKN